MIDENSEWWLILMGWIIGLISGVIMQAVLFELHYR